MAESSKVIALQVQCHGDDAENVLGQDSHFAVILGDRVFERLLVGYFAGVDVGPTVYSSLLDIRVVRRQISSKEEAFFEVAGGLPFKVLGSQAFIA